MDFPEINQRNTLYNENKNYIDENNLLKDEFENLKKQIVILKREKYNLENEKNISKNESINSNNENNTLHNELNIKIENSQIKNSINEIKNLKINNNINLEDIIRDELISIQFKTKDQKVDLFLTCKNTDIFIKIEEKLYDKYPEYKEYNTYFTVNGRSVKRFKTIQENNIKNFDNIFLEILE